MRNPNKNPGFLNQVPTLPRRFYGSNHPPAPSPLAARAGESSKQNDTDLLLLKPDCFRAWARASAAQAIALGFRVLGLWFWAYRGLVFRV